MCGINIIIIIILEITQAVPEDVSMSMDVHLNRTFGYGAVGSIGLLGVCFQWIIILL